MKKIMSPNKLISNNRGQVALVLIFLAAVGLILYAMTVNMNRLSGVKVLVTIAGNSTAAGLASKMASYGENVMQTQLGGRKEKCDYTSILSAIVSFIIVIIIVIIMVVCHQYELSSSAGTSVTTVVAMVAAVVLSAASIVIQAVYIQPMITRMWNKMQAQISTTEDMFLEGALQMGLQKSVSDEVKVRDFYDYDMDGLLAKPMGPFDTSDYNTWPTVSRFVFFYTERLKTYRNMALVAAANFINTVNNFTTSLGIETNTTCCSGNTAINPEFCDKCCVLKDIRQQSCHPDIEDATLFPEVPDACLGGPFPGYPLSYDRFFCNRQNPLSLPGLLGLDDSNRYLRKSEFLSTISSQVSDDDGTGVFIFRGEDSEGFLFPLLWLARDGVAYINNLTTSSVTANSKNCHWCATGGGATPPPLCSSATDKSTYRFWYYPYTKKPYSQLELTHPCEGDGCCTNRFIDDPYYTTFSLDNRIIDGVGRFIPTINGVTYSDGLFDDDPPLQQCPSIASGGYWRSGNDDFCSTTAPYYMGTPTSNLCTKWIGMTNCLSGTFTSSTECTCPSQPTAANRAWWFNDNFDDIIFWWRTIAADIEGLLAPNGVALTAQNISDSVDTWAANAQLILREIDGCPACTCNGSGVCTYSGACTGGVKDIMDGWRTVFSDWLNNTTYSYTNNNYWCLPANSNYLMLNEYNNVVEGGILPYGNVRTVLNCLKYNANIIPNLQACKAYCDANPTGTSASYCQNLPRSLLLPTGARGNTASDLNAIYTAGGCAQTQSVTINGTSVTLPFSDIITLTLRLAYDQAAKMQKRYDYLYNLYEYVRVMREGLTNLTNAMSDSIVQNIKNAICLVQENKSRGMIENVVYYGWCTDWDAGDEICAVSGRWHVSRVEAWLPRRCAGYAAGCCTNNFPWVRTSKSGCCKRCYFMQDHTGRIRVRILRYDAPTGAVSQMINFANGFPLWQFRESNPYATSSNLQNLYQCQVLTGMSRTIAPGAFLINGTAVLGQKNALCQNAIVAAMRQAVGNETCAYYYLQPPVNRYRIRFGRCDDACNYDPNN